MIVGPICCLKAAVALQAVGGGGGPAYLTVIIAGFLSSAGQERKCSWKLVSRFTIWHVTVFFKGKRLNRQSALKTD